MWAMLLSNLASPLTDEPALSFPGTTDPLGLNHVFLLSPALDVHSETTKWVTLTQSSPGMLALNSRHP